MTGILSANRAAMLRAVLVDPYDELARLAYADVCEEEGNTGRAEYIRDPRSVLPGRWTAWLDAEGMPADLFATEKGSGVRFGNGFVQMVRCPLDRWLSRRVLAVSSQPITEVQITDRQPWSGRWHRDDPEANIFGWWTAMSFSFDGTASGVGENAMAWMAEHCQVGRRETPTDYRGGHGCVMYTSPRAAQNALSDTLVNMARRDAGLPLIDFDARRAAGLEV